MGDASKHSAWLRFFFLGVVELSHPHNIIISIISIISIIIASIIIISIIIIIIILIIIIIIR